MGYQHHLWVAIKYGATTDIYADAVGFYGAYFTGHRIGGPGTEDDKAEES